MSSTQYVDVNSYLETVEQDLCQANAEAVRAFINHCAAEGIGENRQQRLAQALKRTLERFAPDGFRLEGATESELKQVLAALNRSDYAENTKHTFRSAIKKFYKVQNGGHDHPDKVEFFAVGGESTSTVSREDLFTKDELQDLFKHFSRVRDRAFAMVLYESAARPGELLERSIGDFTTNEHGDFIYLEGSKGTPDRTNQLVRSGRAMRAWLATHPLGGTIGDIEDASAPLWVKSERQACRRCGKIPRHHDDSCDYEPDFRDRMSYDGFRRRFKKACERADIPENKRRPYNLRHTRLTEVATFMGYEQLNKFAGWTPGSDRAKVYVHLNNDDVNKAIRDEYGLSEDVEEESPRICPYCSTENQPNHTECRQCGRPLSMETQAKQTDKVRVLERLTELEEQGVLDQLQELDAPDDPEEAAAT